ncbi:plasmid mobilization relaxosome protein MobC [Sulfurimonas sp.]|uniref:plasmid mobilization relaxosome protein MobC n=1 Tax=Sulfurimonas sp. TaxID=2022749 RepID=UPI002AB18741|nr:plasmid mobilization relaxosome protein MobC [Sulfurimonas sp.]
MNKNDYQKTYKQGYKQINKFVTFPVKNIFYEELRKRSFLHDLSVNAYAKTIVTNFLSTERILVFTKEETEYINQYIRISRGIATNINQIAHKTNIGEYIDTNILLNSLQRLEVEFKKFISKN